jgi:hypothetical protein
MGWTESVPCTVCDCANKWMCAGPRPRTLEEARRGRVVRERRRSGCTERVLPSCSVGMCRDMKAEVKCHARCRTDEA